MSETNKTELTKARELSDVFGYVELSDPSQFGSLLHPRAKELGATTLMYDGKTDIVYSFNVDGMCLGRHVDEDDENVIFFERN
tara:strand:- start:2157 stop:2405 length:249 start_codon:yes stop_codon:yes gene_type:complete